MDKFFAQSVDEIKKHPPRVINMMVQLALQAGDSPATDPDVIIRRMDVILALSPGNPIATIHKASAVRRKGDMKEALRLLEPVRQNLLRLPLVASMRLEEILIGVGALEEAEADLRKIEKEWPTFVEARFLLSRVIYMRGRVEEAEARLKEDLKLFPKFAGGMILLAEINEQKGNLKVAEEYYLQAEPFIKDSPLIAERLTRLYVKMGKKERAQTFLKKYREHRAANPEVAGELSRLVNR